MKLSFDKKLHVAFGAFFGLTSMLIAKDLGASDNTYMAIGVLTTILVAVGKEVRDKVTKKGTFEKADILATIAGGFYSTIFYYAFTLIIEFIKNIF